MRAVPIVLGGDVLGTIVRILQVIRGTKLLNGILNAAGPTEFMPAHVMCMRNGGRYAQVRLAMKERFFRTSDVFVGMSQIVMRSRIIRRNYQRCLVKRDGIQVSCLTVPRTRPLIREAAQDPKPRVARIRHQRIINGFAIRYEFVEILLVFEEFHLPGADCNPTPLSFCDLASKRLRFIYRSARRRHILQLHVNVTKTSIRSRQRWIQSQGLTKGAGCLDPDIRTEIVNSLIVKSLSSGRGRRHFFVEVPNLVPELDGPVENLPRDPADRVISTVSLMLPQRRRDASCQNEHARNCQMRDELQCTAKRRIVRSAGPMVIGSSADAVSDSGCH